MHIPVNSYAYAYTHVLLALQNYLVTAINLFLLSARRSVDVNIFFSSTLINFITTAPLSTLAEISKSYYR